MDSVNRNVDGSNSSNGGMQISQNGGPRGDRPRKGEMAWIPNIKKPADIRSWNYKFRTGAGLFLSDKVYDDTAERKLAWEMALLKSAADFEEMCLLIQLFSNAGYECEDLIDKLVSHYLPSLDIDRKKTAAAFMAFARGRLSLHAAVKEYSLMLLECKKYDFDPGDIAVCAKLEALLKPEEMVSYKLYLNMQPAGMSARLKSFSAIEALGKDQEDCGQDETDGPLFAGGAFTRGKKSRERRSGYDPKEGHGGNYHQQHSNNQQGQETKPCVRCGKKCPLARGGDKSKCYAYDKKCRKCDKLGHFESMCKSKKTAAAVVDKAKAEAAKRGDSNLN